MEYNRLINGRPLVGLSPMAGYTDSPYRAICRKLGADFVVTELVSADGIIQSYKAGERLGRTYELMAFGEGERPVFVQLFGGEPTKIAEAAKIVVGEMNPDGIDINMGCPAHKVVCNGFGCALLKNPALAAEVVRAAKKGSGLSVTVKTRVGWSDDTLIDQFALAIEGAGASMLALHGRTYEQGFSGVANWEPIYRIKRLVNMPVFGNGDIFSGADAVEKVRNLDGILIGRASVGNPWIFAEVKRALGISSDIDIIEHEVSWPTKFAMLRYHAKLKQEQKGERGLIEMRKFLPAYIKGLAGASELRGQSNTITSLADIDNFITQIQAILHPRGV